MDTENRSYPKESQQERANALDHSYYPTYEPVNIFSSGGNNLFTKSSGHMKTGLYVFIYF